MTPSRESDIERIAKTNSRGHQIRRSEFGVFIKPSEIDNDGELHISIEELGQALALLGWNRADLFPEG